MSYNIEKVLTKHELCLFEEKPFISIKHMTLLDSNGYKLRVGDLIKLGKIGFRIRESCFNPPEPAKSFCTEKSNFIHQNATKNDEILERRQQKRYTTKSKSAKDLNKLAKESEGNEKLKQLRRKRNSHKKLYIYLITIYI